MKKTLNKGFTLIELLVVVAIIAVLALIVLLALNPVEMARRSRDSRRLSDLGTVRKAIDLALADKQSLATTAVVTLNSTSSVTDFAGMGLNISKYLSVVPQDPMYESGSSGNVQVVLPTCLAGSTTKANMVYEFISDGSTYVLRARLESLDNCDAIKTDGNNGSNYYETGTDPGLNLFP